MPHTNEDTEKEIENEEAQTEDLQPNLQTGSITVQKDGHFIHCLTVIGQIEGHYILPSQNKTTKYEHVIPQLVAIEESDDVEGLLIILNTVGGDVEAGWPLPSCCPPCERQPPLWCWVAATPSACPWRCPVGAVLLCPAPP